VVEAFLLEGFISHQIKYKLNLKNKLKMKKLLLIIALVITTSTFAQKKNSNGKIYDKHPAINTVESFTKAFVEGSQEELKALVSDDFKWWQMNAMMPKPLTIENLIARSEYLAKNVIGFSVTNR